MQMSVNMPGTGIETIGDDIFDAECLKLINEYFYGKIFSSLPALYITSGGTDHKLGVFFYI